VVQPAQNVHSWLQMKAMSPWPSPAPQRSQASFNASGIAGEP
jgi:hypothetical protein